MNLALLGSFAERLKALRETAGYTQEELAAIAGLSVHAISALERGERRRPHMDTVRALSSALDLRGEDRDAFVRSARGGSGRSAAEELSTSPLPLAPTALLGRERDLERLRGWAGDAAARLVTLTGPGGVGKTRLALEMAHAAAADGGAGQVAFVALAAAYTMPFVASAIAGALGISDVGAAELPRRLRAACGDRPMLLVLDNFEQVLDAAPLVVELLAAVPPLRLLVTSRAPLRVRGEREYVVEPLELRLESADASPEEIGRTSAVRLFVERVRDVQPSFQLTAENARTVLAICQRLDALPLALELAAPWLRVLPADDLLRRLALNVLLSRDGARDLPERQQTMNATVAWSYKLLAAHDQRLFRSLSVLPTRFCIEAATGVVDDEAGDAGVLSGIAGLMEKSLLARAETAAAARPMYQMLETVRAYGSLELDRAGERARAMDGLVRYCLREVALAADGLARPEQAEWLDRMTDDLGNYRAALGWLIARERPQEAGDIAWALLLFWLIRGHGAEGLSWYEQILALPARPAAVDARALAGTALMQYSRGALPEALDAVGRALAVAHAVGDPRVIASAETVAGHVENALGHLDAARRRFSLGQEAFEGLGLAWGIGSAINGLGSVALAAGDTSAAERLFDRSAAVLRDSGPWFITPALCLRAVVAVQQGDADRALAIMRDSLRRIRRLHDRFAFVYALVPIAGACLLQGRDVWAARILGMRDAVSTRTGAVIANTDVRALGARLETQLRARLGDEAWERARESGHTMSIDELLTELEAG